MRGRRFAYLRGDYKLCNQVRNALHDYAQEVWSTDSLTEDEKVNRVENVRKFHEWLVGNYTPGIEDDRR